MFDIGWPELMLIMVIALIVIGPKELPGTIRTVVGTVRKMRGMMSDLKSGLSDFAQEAGVDDIKRSIADDVTYDPKAALENIADIDGGEFSTEGGGNSILDPVTQSQSFNDDPSTAPAKQSSSASGSATGSEDKPAPRPATPASGNS